MNVPGRGGAPRSFHCIMFYTGSDAPNREDKYHKHSQERKQNIPKNVNRPRHMLINTAEVCLCLEYVNHN